MINFRRFNIEHLGKEIVLDVELAVRHKGEKIKICTTDDVLKELKERGVKVGKCIERPDLVSDRNDNRISGRWIFGLPTEKKQVISQKPSRKTTKASKK